MVQALLEETPERLLKLTHWGGDNVLDPWVSWRERGCVVGSHFCALPLVNGSMSTYYVCVGNHLKKKKKAPFVKLLSFM